MDVGLVEDADANLGGDEGVVIDNDDDGSEANDEVEGDVGDDNNDDDCGGHLVLNELSLHPLPGIDLPDGGYGVTYVLQASNEQQRVDLQGLQNVQNPPWINLAGFIISVEARDLFLPKFIPVSMANPNGDIEPMGTFDIHRCEDAGDLMLNVAHLVNPVVIDQNTGLICQIIQILNHDDIAGAYWPLVVQGLSRVVTILPINDDPPSVCILFEKCQSETLHERLLKLSNTITQAIIFAKCHYLNQNSDVK
ncbi:hypothetical protein ACFX1R_028696 [Malus domestica]